jgi:hypothetical protein
MYRTTSLLGGISLLGLIAGFSGAVGSAGAQACIEDRYGRIICGQPVNPYGGPGYGEPPPDRYYAPPPRREYGPPPDRGGGDLNLNNLGRLLKKDEPRYRPPVRGRNGQLACQQRGYTIQDGLCKPYTGR